LASTELTMSRLLKVRHIPSGMDTCTLDVADRGEHTLEEIGQLLGVTRERVRQIELAALFKLRNQLPAVGG
jgi:hypothetical protein